VAVERGREGVAGSVHGDAGIRIQARDVRERIRLSPKFARQRPEYDGDKKTNRRQRDGGSNPKKPGSGD
jgi:hypothetical protein